NAGDFGWFLVNASHPYAITKDDYETKLTDGHLDVDSVREGSTLIVPVKVEGGGVYAGDVHAMQGDGEVAGHTTDVTAKSIVEVSLIKNLYLEGPILLPPEEDLPPLARPWRKDEWENVSSLARRMKIEVEPVAPVQIIGSGPTLNDAVARGLVRASKLFGMSVEEIKNRVTISGAVEIGRLPGVVQITLQTPLRVLERLRLDRIATSQYKLPY
ncbi:MAG: acetamidase/formamidase family protein, partial [Zestosphaera sp.]